jgi:uncharacterized protein YndB with AHSA1/START domain
MQADSNKSNSFSIEIEATAQQVWAALTSKERLRDWFNATTTIEPRQGGHLTFEGVQGEVPYQFAGEITTFETKQELSARMGDVLLSFIMSPGTTSTTVELRHSGFEVLAGGGQFWDGDELIPLRELVTGVGPTH